MAKQLQNMKGEMEWLNQFLEDKITRVSLLLEEKEKCTPNLHTKEEEEDAQLSV